jgi:hypothetical protein
VADPSRRDKELNGSGASYTTANGFLEPYGDHDETAITSAGETIATWGEGNSDTGPGGVWVNRQT